MSNNLLYGVSTATPQGFPAPVVATRDPLVGYDRDYPIGQTWVNNSTYTYWGLCGFTPTQAQWVQLAITAGAPIFNSLTVNPGPTAITGQFTLTAGANAVSFAADASDHNIAIGSATGTSALTINAGTGASSLTTVNGAFTLNSGTGAISISGDASNTTIGLGDGAGDKIINIGGIGANTITLGDTQAGGTISIGGSLTTGSINIGGAAQIGQIFIGTGTGAQAISIGSGAGAKIISLGGAGANTINIGLGQAAGTISIGASMTTGTISIGGAVQTNFITIGSGTGAQSIGLGTGGTGIKTIVLGGSAANVIRIGDQQTGGSILIGSLMTLGTISIGGTAAQTGNFDLAPGTGVQAVTLANAGTGIKTVSIASGAVANVVTIGSVTGAASTTIRGGTVGIALNAAGAVSVQPSITAAQTTVTPTLNARVGSVLFDGTNATVQINAGASKTFTISNNTVTATSVVSVTASSVEAIANVQLGVTAVQIGASSIAVIVRNSGGSNTGGNFNINFWILS